MFNLESIYIYCSNYAVTHMSGCSSKRCNMCTCMLYSLLPFPNSQCHTLFVHHRSNVHATCRLELKPLNACEMIKKMNIPAGWICEKLSIDIRIPWVERMQTTVVHFKLYVSVLGNTHSRSQAEVLHKPNEQLF